MLSNIDLSRVYLAGDSAGGNIVHHLAIQVAGKNLDRLILRGLVLIQPFFGGEERTLTELREKNPLIISQELLDWFWKAYLPPDSNRDHPASNIFGPHSKDISNVPVPPVIMFIGGRDILQDWQVRYSNDLSVTWNTRPSDASCGWFLIFNNEVPVLRLTTLGACR